jgi:hypothetical protein
MITYTILLTDSYIKYLNITKYNSNSTYFDLDHIKYNILYNENV